MLTDLQIANLLAEPKPEVDPVDFLTRLGNKDVTLGHRRHAVPVTGEHGNRFTLSVRQSVLDPYNFSVILTYTGPDGVSVNLRRHNGPTHPHLNPLEDERFSGVFHVHMATERYQRIGDAERFAEPTDAFNDLATAFSAMLSAANFAPPAQLSIEIQP